MIEAQVEKKIRKLRAPYHIRFITVPSRMNVGPKKKIRFKINKIDGVRGL